ncbi:MerR family DNA-binding transcriptional regulator [Amycolatopsis iheyensis]
MLRYYEEQCLIRPRREENGYRSYAEPQVERVRQEGCRGIFTESSVK